MPASICSKCRTVQSNPTGFCKNCGARLVVAEGKPEARRGTLWQGWGALTWAGIVAALALVLMLAVWGATAGSRTPDLPTPTAVPATPQAALVATPVSAAAPTVAAPTPTVPRGPTRAAAPPPAATRIDPPRVSAIQLPITLTVSGTNLDQVHDAGLNSPSGVVSTSFQSGTDEQFTLTLNALPSAPNRELTLTLQLDGKPQAAAAVVVQDYIANKPVEGVQAAYAYTDRVNPTGPFTRMRAEPNVASTPQGTLYNGDTVDVLRDDVERWYQIRIQTSRDAGQVGLTGWIERWLIENKGVPPIPPSPTPLPIARFSSRVDVNFEGSGNSGQFRSCVAGFVRNAEGKGYVGALINVNNGPKNRFNTRTVRNGEYRICGLGASHWDVILVSVPNMALARQPVGTVYVNGDGREAIVHFFQQR